MKKNLSLNMLLYNNRFVMVFSIVVAVVVWLIVAVQFSPPEDRIIKDVPVKIDMSQSVNAFDLQIFGTSEFTVDVTVKGKRYIVAQSALTAEDIIVTANTNYVDSAGKYSLQLDVKKKSPEAEYAITDVSAEYVDVYFDTYKEGEYLLVPAIVSSGAIIPEGYYKDAEILSAKTVKISGPTTEINKIDKVLARTAIDSPLTATKTLQAEIVPLGEYENVLRYLTVNNGNADITITIPVYKIAVLPVTVTFINTPAFYLENPLEINCTPRNATFGIDETLFESTKTLSIATIDFNTIKAGKNELTVQSAAIEKVKVLDSNNTFKIIINAGKMSERRMSVPQANITLINSNPENKVSLKNISISNVTVVGPQQEIATILASDIFAEIDLENKLMESGTFTVSAKVYLKNHDNCWIYGKYSVDIFVAI